MKEDEKKELIWIPARLKKEFDSIQDDKQKEFLILKYIEECKSELKFSIENLDEDVAAFKGAMIKAKRAFEDAKTEQLSASYELWEKFDKELPKLTEKVEKAKAKIAPLKTSLDDVNVLLEKITTYDIQRLLELVKELTSYLSYDNDTAKILRFLFENYKK